jgi:hypothetical protein
MIFPIKNHMKLFIKIAVISFVLFLLFVLCVYSFLVLKGPPFVAQQLEGLTRKKVTVGYFGITPTLRLELKNVSVENQFKADRIVIAPSFLSLITGNIGFHEIRMVNPELTYEKFPAPVPVPQLQVQPAVTTATPASVPLVFSQEEIKKAKIQPSFIFRHIIITGGKINFIDHTAGTEGIKLVVKDVSFKISNLCLRPRSATVTRFELKGSIPWQAGEEAGRIFAEGWLDLYKKDMYALLKVEGIDGIYLYPYYSQWVNLQKTSIEKAKLDFSSTINGLNNNVAAVCHFELRDIVFRERPAEEKQDKAEKIAKAVLKFFKTLDNGKIEFNFTYKTKMTRPEFGLGLLVGAVEDKLTSGIQAKKRPIIGDIFVLPVRLLESTVKAGSDLSKAVIDGTVAVGKELKKATQASFTREK